MEKSNKMLIDATHPEETRVVVLRNGRVEEFDYESAARKLLRGNIYLAKVTRVEPSLQAAFVDYGGNRHGFLAFSEIHPDYYQIPVADRQALLQEEAEAEAKAEAEADARAEAAARRGESEEDEHADRAMAEAVEADAKLRSPRTPPPEDWPASYEAERAPARSRRNAGEGQGRSRAGRRAETAAPGRESGRGSGRESGREWAPEGSEGGAGAEADPFAPTQAQPEADTEQPTEARSRSASGPEADRAYRGTFGSDLDQPSSQGPWPRPEPDAGPAPWSEPGPGSWPEPASGLASQRQAHAEGEREATLEVEPSEAATQGSTNQLAEGDASDSEAAREHDGGHAGNHVEEIAGDASEPPETVSTVEPADSADAMEEVPERPRRRVRPYKIQEVIKRRQIILVQVVKEERGSKGAALTTYLSLAGRYTVLMPNTGRGGGISRKITNPQDRKRLKAIAADLEVPEGMGLIIRTAGAARTKQEIKRDFEYEIRLWENVRELTLTSTAPCLVYEEGNLIKRSIRDLYSKDLDQILVAGDSAHTEAHNFMSMLSPGQAKSVVRYDDPEPLFSRFLIERQLNAMFSPYVTLRSGGYLVINQTEALVSIDVNSGKATREFSIEETALQTNLEAAEEIARQLKLRDLAGLIVIDFIDMEERRNNRKVESRLKDALRHDRARIQVGRISHFGLLEMSRQRLRTGVLEGSTSQCPHCQGTGIIRSVESVALAVLRALEDQLLRDVRHSVTAVTTAEVALYILNNKRAFVTDMEGRYGVAVMVQASDRMQGANFAIEKSSLQAAPQRAPERTVVNMESGFNEPAGEESEETADAHREEAEAAPGWEREREEDGGRRGRGRRRRRGRREERHEQRTQAPERADIGAEVPIAAAEGEEESLEPIARTAREAVPEPPGSGEQPSIEPVEESERRARRRRRGRRGGRRGRERDDNRPSEHADAGAGDTPSAPEDSPEESPEAVAADGPEEHEHEQRQPEQELRQSEQELRQPEQEQHQPEHANGEGEDAPAALVGEAGSEDAARVHVHVASGEPPQAEGARSEPPPEGNGAHHPTQTNPGLGDESAYAAGAGGRGEGVVDEPPQPARKGWWQRRFSA